MSLLQPAEHRTEHTRILRVMLAAEDCVSYWKSPPSEATGKARVHTAFEQRWFGNKSESRVTTLIGDMALRFDAYPAALEALRIWNPPREVVPWICHSHTQLADPIYRRFTGEFLPKRREQGYTNVDRETVARWLQQEWPGKWAPSTCIKFGSNMLSTASEAGVVKSRKDPRKLSAPHPPKLALEYLFYLLREVEFEGSTLGSPYVSSLLPSPEIAQRALRGIDSVRLRAIGDVQDFEWSFSSIQAWAEVQAGIASKGATG